MTNIPVHIHCCCKKLHGYIQEIGQIQNEIAIGKNQFDEHTVLELGLLLRDALTLCQSVIDYSFVVFTGNKDFQFSLPLKTCIDFIPDKIKEIEKSAVNDLMSLEEADNLLEGIYFEAFENFERQIQEKKWYKDHDLKLPCNGFLRRFSGVVEAMYEKGERTGKIKYFELTNSQLVLFNLINYYKHVGFADLKYKNGDIHISWDCHVTGKINRKNLTTNGNSVKQFLMHCISFVSEVFLNTNIAVS